jgi:hypothetical protein
LISLARIIAIRRWRVAGYAVVMAIATQGCGGAAHSRGTVRTAPGRAEPTDATVSSNGTTAPGAATNIGSGAASSTIRRADAICARRNREATSVAGPGSSLQQIVASAARRATIERHALSELRQLTPPATAASDWQAILSQTGRALKATEMLARRDKGASNVASLRRQVELIDKPQLRLLIAATHAGMKPCSLVGGPSLTVPLQAR